MADGTDEYLSFLNSLPEFENPPTDQNYIDVYRFILSSRKWLISERQRLEIQDPSFYKQSHDLYFHPSITAKLIALEQQPDMLQGDELPQLIVTFQNIYKQRFAKK